ncbi:MAG: cation-translocating P-type ATPase [Clostridia bacterium]|nr:cation-translocating P-type ATPase [Clostridia bacterium]
MENIDHIAKNSLDSIARNNLSEEGKKHIVTDVATGMIGIAALVIGLVIRKAFPDRETVASLIFTVGIAAELIPILYEAVRGIIGKNLTRSMEILVSIAVIACFFSGQLVTAILIPLILNAAHILEERSIMGGRQAIEGLKKMQIASATVIREDGSYETVKATSLKPGDILLIHPGAGFPSDGTVVEGNSFIDQKSLTGEPEPVRVSKDSRVFAGTLNIDGTLRVRVDRNYSDTSFSNIIKLLEQAEKMDTPESRLVDRFMRYYIPFILAVAAAAALIKNDISTAVAILVVSCPCGQMLVSSAPMVAALSSATKRGILIKNSKFIEKITEADSVVFDKTGTLTSGELSLTGIYSKEPGREDLILAAAEALAAGSSHPVSKAVCTYAASLRQERALPVIKIADIHEVPGLGMTAEIISADDDGGVLRPGSLIGFGRIAENCSGYPWSDADGTLSILYVGDESCPLGALSFEDTLREDAAQTVSELRKNGIERAVMLTGDRRKTAEKISSEAGIDLFYSELLPENKYKKIKEIKEISKSVIAVGDGINDAPALKEADVGIAMGAMGSDLAIQSADIALMNNRLGNIPFVIRLAGRTRRIIYQNLVMSVLISFTMIILSAFGLITPVFGAFFHNIGAFAVLINSSRIMRSDGQPSSEDIEK